MKADERYEALLQKREAKIRMEMAEKAAFAEMDAINHPSHYTKHPSGIECIQITEWMNCCLGNAFKYIWRAGLKNEDPTKDLRKAIWYLEREIDRIGRN